MDAQPEPALQQDQAIARNARLHDFNPPAAAFESQVLSGLSGIPKELPAKFFYDTFGAQLFEQICELEEYYPTRTETAIMRAHAIDMARHIGPMSMLVEYGSGSSRKTRILLDALKPAVYLPIDISRDQLIESARALALEYPAITVDAICADYSVELALPGLAQAKQGRRIVYFPGSTIGNFTPPQAREFLAQTARLVGAEGGLLIGVDLKKDSAILNAAYNDAKGVTAAFNLNLLTRINRELGADFDLLGFEHWAFYNETLARIEMHLRARTPQTVHIRGQHFDFSAGETIHSENSYKYSVDEFSALGISAGWSPVAFWTDSAQLFSVHYFTVA